MTNEFYVQNWPEKKRLTTSFKPKKKNVNNTSDDDKQFNKLIN